MNKCNINSKISAFFPLFHPSKSKYTNQKNEKKLGKKT